MSMSILSFRLSCMPDRMVSYANTDHIDCFTACTYFQAIGTGYQSSPGMFAYVDTADKEIPICIRHVSHGVSNCTCLFHQGLLQQRDHQDPNWHLQQWGPCSHQQ